MSNHSILSNDERHYLRKLLKSETTPGKRESRDFQIDGGEAGNALLAGLASHSKLTMESHFDDCWMSFPLQLAEDELHALQLKLGAPKIFEYGPNQRPWRLHLDPPITLLDARGADTGLQAQQLSPNGLLVELGTTDAPPCELALCLPLPGREPIPFKAVLVRSTGARLAAYRLSVRHPAHTEALRQFIFQQHRLQHPELELNVPT